ncbi:MAG: RluA family pseudouridine synthase [Acidobacteria bacterium]|nr:RluA family pseudouridine synthase [Acidobacteriota bacterium]
MMKKSGESRLARKVQTLLGSSYSHAKREVEVGHVRVNGHVETDVGRVVHDSDQIDHNISLPRVRRRPDLPDVTIVHLDDALVVVEKPPGLLVHPTLDREKDTLLSRGADAVQRKTGRRSPLFIVHRIDRDTSGLLVLARDRAAVPALQRQFRVHTITRRYLAIVAGDLANEVVVDRAIGRPRPGARRAALRSHGKEARTVVRPIERLRGATMVEATLGTGRTHQVRVHFAWLGHPVLGDALYGQPASDPAPTPRMALHASELAFTHPQTGERLAFRSPLPPDLEEVLRSLRR